LTFFEKVLDFQRRGDVYVVAELGSNFKSIQDLLGAITLAKACGANAIKYQYLTPKELYGPSAGGQEIDKDFPLHLLKEKCDATGIDFLCSSFSPKGLKQVDKFVDAHKIASSEMAHIRLLEAAVATGKPIILSTGAYFPADIRRTLEFLGTHPVILMHCNVAYPARYTNLKKFDEIKTFFKGPLGFSDHTTSVDLVPRLYKELGVSVYEKHFNPFDYKGTPDAPHSLDRDEFKCMVSYLRGSPNDFNEETEARLVHVRRIIALKDLMPGDILKEGENIGIFRVKKPDTRGVSPFAISKLEGKMIGREIKEGDGVSLADLK